MTPSSKTGGSKRPLRAVQVGRRGEVAGGMTQVVNGYLEWSFDEFSTPVIVSRDGSSGAKAVRVALRAAGQMLRLRDRDKTVVVVHLSQGGSFVREGMLLMLAHRRGFATIAQLHGSAFAQFARSRPGLVKRVLGAADSVLTLSEESAAIARDFVAHDAVELIPNAVAGGTGAEKERLVVFGGAVAVRKGVDVLVAAWKLIQEAGAAATADWRLVIAGPVLDPSVVPAGLPAADFVGSLDHDALMQLLDRSSIAVLPSRDEAMPLFILEALGRSNYVISTDVGGIAAVLDHGAGVLTPVGDAAALADALTLAMSDEAQLHQTAATGRAAFDATYSAAAVFPEVERIWAGVLAAKSARATGSARR